jgi:hypothetical protein
MKTYILALLITLLIACTPSNYNYKYNNSTTIRYYDHVGCYTGKSVTSGDRTRYYDKHNNYIGYGDFSPAGRK